MSSDTAPLIFDRALLVQRRARAARDFDPTSGADFLLARACDNLIERVQAITRPLDTLAVQGAFDGRLAALLHAFRPDARVLELDAVAMPGQPMIVADEEALPLKAGAFDAVVSCLVLQHVNDLPGALVQLRQALKPDGLLLATLIGGESLTELRQAFVAAESELEGGASPRVAPFADGRDLAGLSQRAGLALPVVDSDRFTVSYATPLALLTDLRAMGATNVLVERRRTPLRRATLLRAMAIYAERFTRADGKVLATFELLTLTAWSPHDSQQKPLRPGSATHRLADALGVRERPAGDKTG